MFRTALTAIFAATLAGAACAEPVENGTEISQLLTELGDRCWAVDVDGEILDAAALSEVAGPIDIELECVIAETTAKSTTKLPNSVI